MVTPQLITPDGKTIELSRETYQKIRKLLGEGAQPAPKSRRVVEIRATFGKYADMPSLVDALRKERAAELSREEAKLKRLHG